jgi:FkbM family methyltransferase
MTEDFRERQRRQFAVGASNTPPHRVFDSFRPWVGWIEPGWSVNFLGVRTRVAFFSLYEQLADYSQGRRFEAKLPVPNEEYFEWVALLEAVMEARDSFTMIELGAGWGRWIVNGVAALRAQRGLPYYVVGVEPEPTHFRWMKQHLKDNDVDFRRATLIEAAVARDDGTVPFHVGEAADWYGQRIATLEEATPARPPRRRFRSMLRPRYARPGDGRSVKLVHAVSVRSVLRELDRVDLLDVDIQSAEAEVLEPARDVLNERVKRVYVATHNPANEDRLRALFLGLDWTRVYDFPGGGTSETPWGRMMFEDGVQLWLNPRL